jgi:(p)ppGpp synthase/HD superfamily hydrolase
LSNLTDGDVVVAIRIARDALSGLTDKKGEPAFDHALRVMLDPDIQSTDEVALAILHDVAEDTQITVDDLAEEFPALREGLDAITRREGETYTAYIERVKASPTAVTVKLADLRDHLHPDRIDAIPESLVARYREAIRHLKGERR